MNVIDQINGSALFAQSAYSASIATKDSLGNVITNTYPNNFKLSTISSNLSAAIHSLDESITTGVVGDLYNYDVKGLNLYGVTSTSSYPSTGYVPSFSSNVTTHNSDGQGNVFSLSTANMSQWNGKPYVSISSNGNYITDNYKCKVFYLFEGITNKSWQSQNPFSGEIGTLDKDNLIVYNNYVKPSYFTNNGISNFNTKLVFSSNEGGYHPFDVVLTFGDLGVTATNTISGIFVPSAVDLSNYYKKTETSSKQEINNSLNSVLNYTTGTVQYVQSNSSRTDFVVESYFTSAGSFLDCYETVNANSGDWSQGGTTYTSPSGTILIDGDTIEGTTSALSTTVNVVDVTPINSYFSAIPGYPFDRYILNRDIDRGGYAKILYGTLSQGISVTIDSPFENPIEIPLTSGGFNLSTYSGWRSKMSAVKSGVVELALKSDLPSYEYDITNKISAINGSAIAAGDEFPVSAGEAVQYVQTNSAGIDDTITNVTTNSGAWGGSALPISAGPGIKVNLVDNTLVFSNDETVLWTNSNPNQVSANVTLTGTLTEPCYTFEKLRFICKGSYDTGETYSASVQAQEFYTNESNVENRVGVYLANRYGSTIYRDTCLISFKDSVFTAYNGSRIQGLTSMTENTSRGPYILQVVGINRK